jgi:hypothetical protein
VRTTTHIGAILGYDDAETEVYLPAGRIALVTEHRPEKVGVVAMIRAAMRSECIGSLNLVAPG